MNLRLLSDAPIHKGTRVLVAVNLDVAMAGGKIRDDFKIREAVPTLKFILRKGGRVRIVSYLGRPGGKVVSDLSMRPVARRLARLLKRKVVFLSDPFDSVTFSRYRDASDILFFENTRFWPGEEENSKYFAARLGRWGDLYINEAFAHSHRAHASVSALSRILPAYAGLHLEREVRALESLLTHPRRPFVAVLGGAKLETKLPLIRRFLRDADAVLVGGALANTILALRGDIVGKSLISVGTNPNLRLLQHKKLHLPTDAAVIRSPNEVSLASLMREAKLTSRPMSNRICPIRAVKNNEYIMDIGFDTQKRFAALLQEAGTIVWNGPLGFAEVSVFAKGTIAVAKAIRSRRRAFTVVGGGDTIAALGRYNLLKGFSHISTGGGAMLEFLAGKKPSGLEALRQKQ